MDRSSANCKGNVKEFQSVLRVVGDVYILVCLGDREAFRERGSHQDIVISSL